MVKDIAETRDQLIKMVNTLTSEYSQMLEDKTTHVLKDNQDILSLNGQNKLQLEEIIELENRNRELNKKCHDYEKIINDYQNKMVEIEDEHKCNDKVSIVKTQADQLEKQDLYIDQLQQKIKFLQGKKNISIKFEETDDIDKKDKEDKKDIGGWSPTKSKTPVPDKVDTKVLEDTKVEEESDDSDSIEYKRIKYKGKKYYIIVGEDPQVVYEYLENEDVGSRVGIRKKKTKGKGYDIDFD